MMIKRNITNFSVLFFPLLAISLLLIVILFGVCLYFLIRHYGYQNEIVELIHRVCFCCIRIPDNDNGRTFEINPVAKGKDKSHGSLKKLETKRQIIGKKEGVLSNNIEEHPYKDKLLAYQFTGDNIITRNVKFSRKSLAKLIKTFRTEDKLNIGDEGIPSEVRKLKARSRADKGNKSPDPGIKTNSGPSNDPSELEEGGEFKKSSWPKPPLPKILPDSIDDTKELLELSPLLQKKESVLVVENVDLPPTKGPNVKSPSSKTKLRSGDKYKGSGHNVEDRDQIRVDKFSKSIPPESTLPSTDYIEYYVYDYDVVQPYDGADDKVENIPIFIQKKPNAPKKLPKTVRFALPGKEGQEIFPTDEVSEHEYTYVEESATYSSDRNLDVSQVIKDGGSGFVTINDIGNMAQESSSSSYVYEYEDYSNANGDELAEGSSKGTSNAPFSL